MPKPLKVEDVTNENVRELCVLRADKVQIGRELECGVLLESAAVSRIHGAFIPLGNYWFYKDNGSTNGSWVNDLQAPAGVLRLIRPGDYVQLADVVLHIVPLNPEPKIKDPLSKTQDFWSLIVFSDEDIKDEFPIPKFGKALIVGGKDGDLQFPDELKGNVQDDPSVVFERRKDSIYVFQVDADREAFLNGVGIIQSTKLKDGDQVSIEPYTILFNCPPAQEDEEPVQIAKHEIEKLKPILEEAIPVGDERTVRGWDDSEPRVDADLTSDIPIRKAPVATAFGNVDRPRVSLSNPDESTMVFKPTQPYYSKITKVDRPTEVVSREYRSVYADSLPQIEKPSLFRPLIYLFGILCVFLLIILATLLMR